MLFHRRQDAQIALDTSRVVIANILLDHLDELVLAGESAFHHKLVQAGMTQSMSRVAHCIDNGPMEGFWGILKRERYYGSTVGVLEPSVAVEQRMRALRSLHSLIKSLENQRIIVTLAEYIGHDAPVTKI